MRLSWWNDDERNDVKRQRSPIIMNPSCPLNDTLNGLPDGPLIAVTERSLLGTR